MIKLAKAIEEKDIEEIRKLFSDYSLELGIDLSFQDFEAELAHLPGDYSAPDGQLLLAKSDDKVVGCIALRRIDTTTCEMKRLYVRPQYRHAGIGKSLCEAVIGEAAKIGYQSMRLDTLPSMVEAISLYRNLGFKEIDAYRFNPIKGTIYMELYLR